MTGVQLYLAVGLPIIAILTSLTVSLIQISSIRDELRGVREDTKTQIIGIRDDTRSQIASLREDIREIRGDIKLLTGKVYELMAKGDA